MEPKAGAAAPFPRLVDAKVLYLEASTMPRSNREEFLETLIVGGVI